MIKTLRLNFSHYHGLHACMQSMIMVEIYNYYGQGTNSRLIHTGEDHLPLYDVCTATLPYQVSSFFVFDQAFSA